MQERGFSGRKQALERELGVRQGRKAITAILPLDALPWGLERRSARTLCGLGNGRLPAAAEKERADECVDLMFEVRAAMFGRGWMHPK